MCKMEKLDLCTTSTEIRSQESVTSTQLKFGVDRILSDEISSEKSRGKSGGEVNHPRPLPYPVVEVCSGYSGRTSSGHIIHVPKPIRPSGSKTNIVLASHRSPPQNTLNLEPKRKRSWSRAVFSNLQRKGLERRFQLQKYITKPDRRQLAATLGLTDAQVKVWFQNRRMKWRHSKMIAQVADSTQRDDLDSGCSTTTITNQD